MTVYEHEQTIKAMDEKFAGQEFLGVADIAKYMDITPNTVTTLIRNGDIPAFRFGKKFKIPREGFRIYLESASAHTDEK